MCKYTKYLVLYLKSYRRMGVQGVCARGVGKVFARGVTLPQIGKTLGVARDNICSRFGSQHREEGMSLIDVWGFSYQFFEPDALIEVPIRGSAK